MTNNEKRAAELADEIVRTDIMDDITPAILEALNAAQAEGYKQGAEKMREDAVGVCDEWAENAASVEPEHVEPLRIITAQDLAAKIEAIPITPPQPAAQEEDNEREMRETEAEPSRSVKEIMRSARKEISDEGVFSRDQIGALYLMLDEIQNALKAAWKEKSK